jgi:hypothetical protein
MVDAEATRAKIEAARVAMVALLREVADALERAPIAGAAEAMAALWQSIEELGREADRVPRS